MSEEHDRPRRRRSERELIIPPTPEHSSFEIGFCEDKNAPNRRKMEDSHSFFYDFCDEIDNGFFAVFDGHGGKSAADWCGEHFHTLLRRNLKEHSSTMPITVILDNTFVEADSYLNAAHGIFSGCTAAMALLRWEKSKEQKVRILYTANVGDTRVVICRNGRAIRLTYDHKGSDALEQQRVRDCGGFIMNERVNGMLAVTRALGDAELKDYVAGRPYTTKTLIHMDHDEWLIIACDGLWDVCTDQEACDFIRKFGNAQEAAEKLVRYALDRGSYDNISVLCVRFHQAHHSN